MDTNTMYIEHYIDLHNYISDNIYELDDDVIFTESIWKKVLIGGLAVGGIALIWKYHKQIMKFIQKYLPDKIKNIFTKLNKVKKAEEKFNDNLHKDEAKGKDEDQNNINNKFNNFIKKLSSSKVKKLYHFENIYNNIKSNDLKESCNKFIIYYNDNIDKLTDDVLNDKIKLKNNTKQKTIHEINNIDDEYNILNKFTSLLKENINNYINNNNHNDFTKIIVCFKFLLVNLYIYIIRLDLSINDLIVYEFYPQTINDKENNYYFKTTNIFPIIKKIYTIKEYQTNLQLNIEDDLDENSSLKDWINLIKEQKNYINDNMISDHKETLKNLIDNKPKFTYININVILEYQSWSIVQLTTFYTFLEKFLDLENNDI